MEPSGCAGGEDTYGGGRRHVWRHTVIEKEKEQTEDHSVGAAKHFVRRLNACPGMGDGGGGRRLVCPAKPRLHHLCCG